MVCSRASSIFIFMKLNILCIENRKRNNKFQELRAELRASNDRKNYYKDLYKRERRDRIKDRELRDMIEKRLMEDLRTREIECNNYILHIKSLEQVYIHFDKLLLEPQLFSKLHSIFLVWLAPLVPLTAMVIPSPGECIYMYRVVCSIRIYMNLCELSLSSFFFHLRVGKFTIFDEVCCIGCQCDKKFFQIVT